MISKARAWPNNAKWARDDAADYLQRIVELSRDLLGHPDPVVAAKAGRIVDTAHRGVRTLAQVGAEVRDEQL